MSEYVSVLNGQSQNQDYLKTQSDAHAAQLVTLSARIAALEAAQERTMLDRLRQLVRR